jgi:hypothetical protein
MFDSGSVTFDGTLDTGAASLGASVFDPSASLEYHQPWEFQGGAAFVTERVELELDVQAYTAIASYSLLSTTQPTLIYASSGPGAPPTVISRPFAGLNSASDGIVNAAFGGHFRVWRDRDFRIHGGIATGRSPVAADDDLFNSVDLLSWTIGVSGSLAKFQFAVGINQRTGTSHETVLRNLWNGEPVRTAIDVRTTGFIYSIAYQF